MDTAAGASDQDVQALQRCLHVEAPEDYVAFLRASNGLEGMIGLNYIHILSVDEIIADPYPCAADVPDWLIIADDGAAALFGFDLRVTPLAVSVIHQDDLERAHLVTLAPSFSAFIELLRTTNWSDAWARAAAEARSP